MTTAELSDTLVCTKCGEMKELDEFYKDKRYTGRRGRTSWCKKCQCEHKCKWRQENRAHVREYNREWRQANRDYRREQKRGGRQRNPRLERESQRRYRERYPEKRKSQRAARKAILQGRMDKPSCCSCCGDESEPNNLCAHHEDYSKPLDVQWLCRTCHGKLHFSEDFPKIT